MWCKAWWQVRRGFGQKLLLPLSAKQPNIARLHASTMTTSTPLPVLAFKTHCRIELPATTLTLVVCCLRLRTLHNPVKLAVVLHTDALRRSPEHGADIGVVWVAGKSQRPAVLQE